VPVPSSADLIRIVSNDAELRSEWANMLAHQLPALPELDSLLSRLPAILGWLDEPSRPLPETQLQQVAVAPGSAPIIAPGIRYWGAGSPLETIRFAATNRLLLEFDYYGKHRLVEPYSVRQAGTGNVLLYGWETASAQIKAFKLNEMSRVKASGRAFSPRYQVEISAYSPIQAAPRREVVRNTFRPITHSPHRGPAYVFECSLCGKRFKHRTNDSTLRPHKDKNGWDCRGRRGYRVNTLY